MMDIAMIFILIILVAIVVAILVDDARALFKTKISMRVFEELSSKLGRLYAVLTLVTLSDYLISTTTNVNFVLLLVLTLTAFLTGFSLREVHDSIKKLGNS